MPEILKIFDEKWIGNLIGFIGGLLGLLTFINAYLLPFKPRMFLGSKAFILAKKAPNLVGKYVMLNSVMCSIQIGNHRNKYGSILDFAIRIYKTHALNPDHAVYFASNTWSSYPLTLANVSSVQKSLFSPFNILPKSERSLHLEFSELLNRSNMIIDSDANMYLEIYYQIGPHRPWKLLRTYFLFFKEMEQLNDDLMLKYTILESHVTRDKIFKVIKTTKPSLFLGASNRTIKLFFRSMSFRLIRKPIRFIRDSLLFIPFSFLNITQWIYDQAVRLPLLRRSAVRIHRLTISSGQPDKVPKTQESFALICKILSKQIDIINLQAEDPAKIGLEQKASELILNRYKMSLKIYIAGDGYIVAQDIVTFQNPKLMFHLWLKDTAFGYYVWHLQNVGYISAKSFALRVFDAFVLHSNY